MFDPDLFALLYTLIFQILNSCPCTSFEIEIYLWGSPWVFNAFWPSFPRLLLVYFLICPGLFWGNSSLRPNTTGGHPCYIPQLVPQSSQEVGLSVSHLDRTAGLSEENTDLATEGSRWLCWWAQTLGRDIREAAWCGFLLLRVHWGVPEAHCASEILSPLPLPKVLINCSGRSTLFWPGHWMVLKIFGRYCCAVEVENHWAKGVSRFPFLSPFS